MRGLLDTSVLIAEEIDDLPDEAAISAASLAELHFGVHLAKDARSRAHRLRRLAEIESRFAPLPIDESVARSYGQLALLTIESRRKVRPRIMDLLIAATAHAHDLSLYTRNAQDFTLFSELIDIRIA